jgi:hypothetical protein
LEARPVGPALGQAAWDLAGMAYLIDMLAEDLAGRCDPQAVAR